MWKPLNSPELLTKFREVRWLRDTTETHELLFFLERLSKQPYAETLFAGGSLGYLCVSPGQAMDLNIYDVIFVSYSSQREVSVVQQGGFLLSYFPAKSRTSSAWKQSTRESLLYDFELLALRFLPQMSSSTAPPQH
ncbi:MAG: hypothetical protein CL920_09590 [Deltaproteobacteria bacterium]|nr:hypothetical protein [Deltaproteobacteria bacterium]